MQPFGTAARMQLARALLALGETDEAVEELEYVVRIDPAEGRAALLLADVYAKQGKTAEALALLRAVDARLPGQAGVAEAIQRLEAGAQPEP
jgi:Tfp pilus assembly protein PilF